MLLIAASCLFLKRSCYPAPVCLKFEISVIEIYLLFEIWDLGFFNNGSTYIQYNLKL